jgi:hypothetical protein
VVLLSKLGLEQQRASQRVDDQLGAHVVGDRPSETVRLDMSGTAAQVTFAQCGGEALIECAGAVKAR